MRKKSVFIGASAFLLSILTMACQGDQVPEPQKPVTPPVIEKPTEPVVSQFTFEDKTFTASFTDADSRLNFEYDSKITFTWGDTQDEAIGVYKIKNNAITMYAGLLKGDSKSSDKSMTFKGRLLALEEGESYYYITPAPKDGEGKWIEYTTGLSDDQINALNTTASSYKLSWDEQIGVLGANANNLRDYFPLVWRGESASLSKEAAAIHVVLNFNENPGTIQSIQLETMAMGSEDKAFPKAYSYANLANVNNNSELASSFKMLFNNASPTVNEGIYIADAFMVTGFVNGLNVFNKKYRIVATCANGTYKSEYRSFPGQEDSEAQSSKNLPTFANGSTYKMTRPMSKAGSMTKINTEYNILSSLGMWSEEGKMYDPDRLTFATTPTGLTGTNGALTLVENHFSNYPSPLYKAGVYGPSYYNFIFESSTAEKEWSDWTDVGTWKHQGSSMDQHEVITTITLTEASEVYLTFVSEFAKNKNMLAYYSYVGDAPTTPKDLQKCIVFPNVSQNGNEPYLASGAPLSKGQTIKLLYTDANGYTTSVFPANAKVGLLMMIDSYNDSGNQVESTSLFKWTQWRIFSDSFYNKSLGNSNWNRYGRANWFFSTNIAENPNAAYFSLRDDAVQNHFGDMQFIISAWGTDNSPKAIETRNKLQINTDGTISAIQ